MLRDCSLETELANMKCKTDPLEEGGVGVDNNFIIITSLIVVVTISIIMILILTILQTIHVCDCQGDLCNKDFASAGDNGGGGGDKSVMVGRFTKVAIVMIVVALVDFLLSVCHSSSSFRYMLSLLVNKQCHQGPVKKTPRVSTMNGVSDKMLL